jgi:hypothetical protein
MADVRPRRWRWRARGVPRYVAAPVEPPAAVDAAADAASETRCEPGLLAVTIARILLAVHFGLPGGGSARRRRRR